MAPIKSIASKVVVKGTKGKGTKGKGTKGKGTKGKAKLIKPKSKPPLIACELFKVGTGIPKWVSYARQSKETNKETNETNKETKETNKETNETIDADNLSYSQQHRANQVWMVENEPGVALVELSEHGSAYQSGVVTPTLHGLLRVLRDATIVIAYADRLCRNVDNLRKIIAPLMYKNHIRIVVSSTNQMFEMTKEGYELDLLKMTSHYVICHEESAIKSRRAKAFHQHMVDTGGYQKRADLVKQRKENIIANKVAITTRVDETDVVLQRAILAVNSATTIEEFKAAAQQMVMTSRDFQNIARQVISDIKPNPVSNVCKRRNVNL